MKKVNWREAPDPAEFRRVVPGGYVAQITNVEDDASKEYLKIYFDIAEGPLKGVYKEQFEKFGNWGGRFFRSYKESALGFFKGFISSVEKSNPGYMFDDDERTLVGKYIGIVLGAEEYLKQNGNIGKRVYVAKTTTPDEIRLGKFNVPEFKKLEPEDVGFTPVDANGIEDDDLPF